jgi:phage-related protein
MPTGTELATAWVQLVPSAEGIEGGIGKALGPAEKEADAAGKRTGGRFATGVKTAIGVGGIAVAARGIADAFNTGLEEIRFGEEISAQTDLFIKNTGAAFSTAWVEEYTLSLSGLSGISEEELQSAGNNVLKFGDVNQDTYERAVASINDMGGAGKNVAGVSEALGKALADPAKGAALLKRQGVLLNEEQQALIENFTAAGDKAGAQGVILDALEGTYGGLAEAAGATAQGGLNKLQNTWENLAGTAVESLMPAITGIVQGLSGFFGFLQENQQFIPIIAIAIGTVLVAAFIAWTASIWAANAALLANPITWIILAIVALIAGIVLLVMNWETVWAFIMDVAGNVVDFLTGLFEGFLSWWNGLWTAVWEFLVGIWTGIVDGVTGFFSGLWEGLQTIAGAFVEWWNGLWQGIWDFLSGIWEGVVSAVQGYFQDLYSKLVLVGVMFISWWNGLWSGITKFLTDTWNNIIRVVSGVREAFANVFNSVANIVRGAFNAVVGFVKGAVNNIIRSINGIIKGINSVAGPLGAAIGLNLKIPTIPQLAKGGTITGSGSVLVGENGPELLTLPRGATVDPDIEGGDGQGNTYVQVDVHPREEMSEEKIGDIAADKIVRRLRR